LKEGLHDLKDLIVKCIKERSGQKKSEEEEEKERKRLADHQYHNNEESKVTKKLSINSDPHNNHAPHNPTGHGILAGFGHDENEEHDYTYGPDLAMGFIKKSHPVRKFLSLLIHHRTYENFILSK
jgi:hypothetical protein